jgi:hypothetical protein
MTGIAAAQAAEPVSQAAFVKGLKAYQSFAVADASVELRTPADNSAAAVEPATGPDADRDEAADPDAQKPAEQPQTN